MSAPDEAVALPTEAGRALIAELTRAVAGNYAYGTIEPQHDWLAEGMATTRRITEARLPAIEAEVRAAAERECAEQVERERARVLGLVGKHRVVPQVPGTARTTCEICLRPAYETGDYRRGRYRHEAARALLADAASGELTANEVPPSANVARPADDFPERLRAWLDSEAVRGVVIYAIQQGAARFESGADVLTTTDGILTALREVAR